MTPQGRAFVKKNEIIECQATGLVFKELIPGFKKTILYYILKIEKYYLRQSQTTL
jgi:hypothetical protein